MKKLFSVLASALLVLGLISCKADISGGDSAGNELYTSAKAVSYTVVSSELLTECDVPVTDLGFWENSVKVSADAFAKMESGDYIIITTENNWSNDERQLQVCLDTEGGSTPIGTYGSLSDTTYLGEWNCYTLYNGNQSTKFTPSDNEIANLKKYGLAIYGKGVKVTSVKVRTIEYTEVIEETEDSSEEITAVNGEIDCQVSSTDLGFWKNSVTVAAKYFAAMESGDYVTITTTNNNSNDERQLQVCLDTEGGSTPIGTYGSLSDTTYLGEWNCYTLYNGNQTTKFTPSDSEIAGLKNNGLAIYGKGVNVTSVIVHVETRGTDLLDPVETPAESEPEPETPVTPAEPETPVTPAEPEVTTPSDPAPSAPVAATSSVQMAKNLVIGWNLGNALDASSCDDWAYNEGLKLEYCWLPHKQAASRDLIRTVSAAGFKTLRLPVSWHNHMDRNTYQIDSAWMNRVKEIVDWALAEDMYVILNIHHDNLTDSQIWSNPGFCLSTDSSIQSRSKDYIGKVWEQIAATFKDYDNRLVFEVLNEPRCIGTDWEWGFWGSNEWRASTYNEIITAYEQVGLNKIRASGGNNASRYVMIPGYAASPSYLSTFSFPTDSASDKLLLSAHAYSPNDFALEGWRTDYDSDKSYIESTIDGVFSGLVSNYVNKGIGVVMGEASASDKNNTSSRVKWAQYYFGKAKASGIPVVLWDNETTTLEGASSGGENHGYFNRVTCAQYFPSIIEAMMNAAYGSSGSSSGNSSSGSSSNQNNSEVVIFDASTYGSAPYVSSGSTAIVEEGGVKYLKVTPDSWNTNFALGSKVSLSGKSEIVVTMKFGYDTTGYQALVQCINNDNNWENLVGKNESITMNPGSGTAKEYSKTITVSSPSVTHLMIAVQETTSGNWDAVSNMPVYISKIVAR